MYYSRLGWYFRSSLHCSTADAVKREERCSGPFDFINPLPKILQNFALKDFGVRAPLRSVRGLLRAKLPDFKYLQYNKVQGQPFIVKEVNAVNNIL